MAISFRMSSWMLLLSAVFLPGVRCGVDVPPPSEEEDEDYPETSGNCSRCGDNRERRAMRLQIIRSQILSQLGLREAPNVTGESLPMVPPLEHLLDRYAMQGDQPRFTPGPEYGEEDDFYLSAERVLAFATPAPVQVEVDSTEQHVWIKMPSSVQSSQVQAAHLWVKLKMPLKHGHHKNLSLYQVSRQLEYANGQMDFIHLKKKVMDKKNKNGHWLVFEVKKTICHWLKHPKENLGFVLHSNKVDISELIEDIHDKSVFVEFRVEKQRHRRVRRMIGLNCEENADEVRCCRYPLTVDFEEFGWDWIIAPKRYEANYCSGECPYVFLQKYPHTHLVQQANPQGSAGPCCAPRKMSSISMLYFDADYNIIYGMLPGMVVDRCGCS